MNSNQIIVLVVTMLNNRYIIPGKDNEKTAKEVVKVYKILEEKLVDGDDDDYDDESPPPVNMNL